jgi:preprotein translocase subunit SecE
MHAVSDERDGVSSADTDSGTEPGNGDPRGHTAVVTRPLRPTGKRTRRLAEVEPEDTDEEPGAAGAGSKDDGGGSKPKKKKAAKKPGDGPSRNPIAFVINFLKEVVSELRKVIWPNRKEMVNYTMVVLVFLIFMVAMIAGVDLGMGKLVTWVFG